MYVHVSVPPHTPGAEQEERGRCQTPSASSPPSADLSLVSLVIPPPVRSTVVLMCSVHGSPLPLSVSLASHAPSLLSCPLLSLPLPRCLQLHLFPSMWRMIAGLLSSLLLMLHFSLLVLAPSLSLSLFTLSASHNAFLFQSSCSLSSPCSRPSPKPRTEGGGGGVRQNVHL